MKKPFLIISAIILGIILTNMYIRPTNVVERGENVWLEDAVDTKQAADIQQ